MDALRHVTYCGLCAEIARVPKQARALREGLCVRGYPLPGRRRVLRPVRYRPSTPRMVAATHRALRILPQSKGPLEVGT